MAVRRYWPSERQLEPLLRDLRAPLSAGGLFGEFEAALFVQMARRVQARESPKVDFLVALLAAEIDRRLHESAA